MKNLILIFAFLFAFVTQVICQSRNIVLSGGWATVQPDNSDRTLNGFKIGGLYEFVLNDHWGVNCSLGLLRFMETLEGGTSQEITNTYQSWPLLVNGKYLVGKNKVQGYIKGAAGLQISKVKLESQNNVLKDHDVGLAFGTGAGVNITLSEKLFLQTEYEFMYQTNSYYKDGIINQVTLGLGLKL